MTVPLQIVQKIKAILSESGKSSDASSPDMARTYADMCEQANERLTRCHDYLLKGMVGEAVHLADVEPKLLELCAHLDFVGVEQWRKMCFDNGWPIPEPINEQALTALNNAYAQGKDLEALLKQYRRSVRYHETRQTIITLKELMRRNPDNKNWLQDLKGFEHKRMKEIAQEYEAAQESQDVNKLAELMVEIDDDWHVERDNVLRSQIGDTLAEFYGKEQGVKGREIIGRLSDAYAAMDLEKTRRAIEEYQSLQKSDYFRPDPDVQQQFEEAHEWYQEEARRRSEDQQFTDLVARLQNELQKEKPGKQLIHLWQSLVRFDRPLPEGLDARACEAIERYKELEKRHRHARLTVTIAVLLLLTGSVFIFLSRRAYEEEKQAWITMLKGTYDDVNLKRFTALLDDLKQRRAGLYESVEIRDWVARIPDLENAVEERHQTFLEIYARLNEIRNNGFVESIPVTDGMVAQARDNAVTTEDRARLIQYIGEWESHKQMVRSGIDAQVRKVLDQVYTIMEGDLSFSKHPPLIVAAKSAQAIELLKTAQAIAGPSPEVETEIALCDTKLNDIQRGAEDRVLQLSQIEEASDMGDYVSAAQTYVRAFPDDFYDEALRRVSDRAEAYRSAIALPKALDVDQNYYSATVLRSLDEVSPANVFWYHAMDALVTRDRRLQEKWLTVRTPLVELEDEPRLVDLREFLFRPSAEMEPVVSIVQGAFQKVGTSRQRGKDRHYFDYRILVYVPKPEDIKPDFNYENIMLPSADGPQNKERMSHCLFVRDMINHLRFLEAGSGDSGLTQEMNTLIHNDDIFPLLKLRLMDLMTGQFLQLTGEVDMKPWVSAQAALKSIDEKLNWLCYLNPDVVEANTRAADILQRYFLSSQLIESYTVNLLLKRAALSRGVEWAGYVTLDGVPKLLQEVAAPQELWVIRENQDGLYEFLVCGKIKENGLALTMDLQPGEIVLTPTDGKSTEALLDDVRQRIDMTNSDLVEWPAGWPANVRW